MSFFTLLSLTALIGCGGGSDLKFGKISGTVKKSDGEPLQGGTITFVQTTGKDKGMKFPAKLEIDGTYKLESVQFGDYGVIVTGRTAADIPKKPKKGQASEEYDKWGQVDIKKNTPAKKYEKPETSGLTIKVDKEDIPFNVDLKEK